MSRRWKKASGKLQELVLEFKVWSSIAETCLIKTQRSEGLAKTQIFPLLGCSCNSWWQDRLSFMSVVLAKQKSPNAVGSLQVSGIGSQLHCAQELGLLPHTSCWESWKYFQAQLGKCTLCFCPWWPVARPGHVCGVEREDLFSPFEGCWQWEGAWAVGREALGWGQKWVLKGKAVVKLNR